MSLFTLSLSLRPIFYGVKWSFSKYLTDWKLQLNSDHITRTNDKYRLCLQRHTMHGHRPLRQYWLVCCVSKTQQYRLMNTTLLLLLLLLLMMMITDDCRASVKDSKASSHIQYLELNKLVLLALLEVHWLYISCPIVCMPTIKSAISLTSVTEISYNGNTVSCGAWNFWNCGVCFYHRFWVLLFFVPWFRPTPNSPKLSSPDTFLVHACSCLVHIDLPYFLEDFQEEHENGKEEVITGKKRNGRRKSKKIGVWKVKKWKKRFI